MWNRNDDIEPDMCKRCGEHEIERDEHELCNDCYYDLNYKHIVEDLEEAIEYVQKHFDSDKSEDYNRAVKAIARATKSLEDNLC